MSDQDYFRIALGEIEDDLKVDFRAGLGFGLISELLIDFVWFLRALKGELTGHHTDHADNIPAVRWYYLLFPIVPCIILLVSFWVRF